MPITDGAQALPWRKVRYRRFASRARVLLHTHSFQAADDVLSSAAAAGLLLSDSKLKRFQAPFAAASPPPPPSSGRGRGWQHQQTDLPCPSRPGFSPLGAMLAKAVLPARALVVAPHHSSPSPSLLPSSKEVSCGIPEPGKRRRTAREGKVLQAEHLRPQRARLVALEESFVRWTRFHAWLIWANHDQERITVCLWALYILTSFWTVGNWGAQSSTSDSGLEWARDISVWKQALSTIRMGEAV